MVPMNVPESEAKSFVLQVACLAEHFSEHPFRLRHIRRISHILHVYIA